MKRNKWLNGGLVAGMLGTLGFMSGCVPQEGAEDGFGWEMIVFLVLLFVIFYFLLIRPQRKRQKEHQELTEGLQKGDRVVTAGGIYGQIESISDDSIVLKVESGTTIRFAKSSVVGKREQ